MKIKKPLFYSVILLFFVYHIPLYADSRSLLLIEIPSIDRENGFDTVFLNESEIMYSLGREISEIISLSDIREALYKGDFPDADTEERVRLVIRINNLYESEKNGFFCDTELSASLEPEGSMADVDGEGFSVSHIGHGENASKAFNNAVSNLPRQFKYSYFDFEKKSLSFRVLDIYQDEVIINGGTEDGFKKGDYFDLFDTESDKPDGKIIITDAEKSISYGRLLECKTDPDKGSIVKKINYLGLKTSYSFDIISASDYSGSSSAVSMEYSRALYVFHPVLSYRLIDVEGSSVRLELAAFTAGVAMLRHFGKISLRSEAGFGKGFSRGRTGSGCDYTVGIIKGGFDLSMTRHFGLFAEAGFMKWFSSDEELSPDTGGFLFGGGLAFKY